MKENKDQKKKKWKKIRNLTIVGVILGLAVFCAVWFYYPFGEGVKTGQLNFVVYKGVIFKTYEGRLIQSGFRPSQGGGMQSNEFTFSITDKDIAERLMKVGGQVVELHYKEYFGALPWRGHSKYIVNEIINISPAANSGIENVPPVVTGY